MYSKLIKNLCKNFVGLNKALMSLNDNIFSINLLYAIDSNSTEKHSLHQCAVMNNSKIRLKATH